LVHRELIVALAAQYQLPAVYAYRNFVTGGGLISYGPDIAGQYRRAAGYVDRILKGEKAADLPVRAPTKYDLVIKRSRGQRSSRPTLQKWRSTIQRKRKRRATHRFNDEGDNAFGSQPFCAAFTAQVPGGSAEGPLRTASFAAFTGRARMIFRAGLALNTVGSFVNGLMPFRSLVAGFFMTTNLAKPGTTPTPINRKRQSIAAPFAAAA
jgi:hypothetical protein